MDDGTTPNYTWWTAGEPEYDVLRHYAYADVYKSWQWHQSANEQNHLTADVYYICEKGILDICVRVLYCSICVIAHPGSIRHKI